MDEGDGFPVPGGYGRPEIPSKKGISMNRITLAAAFTLATLSTAAVAQTAQEQQLCIDDAFRVCSATIPDRARTTACMIQHKAELSAGCQAVMAKYAPANEPAPTTTVATTTRPTPTRSTPASLKTVSNQRPGKPLNILIR